MVSPSHNPFEVLSLFVAPAILTNASSLLIMSTSNRLARAVDRARELAKQLEQASNLSSPLAARRLIELTASERRATLLVTSLQRFYVAMGGFALATLVSLIGAVIAPWASHLVVRAMEATGVAAAIVAVGGLLTGSWVLLRETRIALRVLQERAALIQSRAAFDAGDQGSALPPTPI